MYDFSTKSYKTVAQSLKTNLIICGRFPERLKVIYIIATKTNSLGTNRKNKLILDW